ncbi:hypothetical protein JZU68_03600 [bacterium]|nr:hypothetical protein [bacterium]
MTPEEFRNNLAIQENEVLYLKPKNTTEYLRKAKEDTGGKEIGFGHLCNSHELISKTIYGIPYENGITREQALVILDYDIDKHLRLARTKLSPTRFDRLPLSAKQLFLDFSFNGALSKFPTLILSIFDKNIKGVMDNYKRYFIYRGKKVELVRRNEFGLKLITELVKEGYFEPLR